MLIKFRFMCVDIPAGKGNGEMEIPDGATVSEALTAYARQNDVGMPVGKLLKSMFLVGSAPAQPGRVLNDGERLTVVRTMEGG